MIEPQPDHPAVTLGIALFSAAAGMVSWASDPNVLKTLGVAGAAGVFGAVTKVLTLWCVARFQAHRRKRKQNQNPTT